MPIASPGHKGTTVLSEALDEAHANKGPKIKFH